jgi:GcrA cell cycle regulator
MAFQWNETTVSALKRHYEANLSCTLIAQELNREFGGTPSRNAVIGKLHRLGLKSEIRIIRRRIARAPRRAVNRNHSDFVRLALGLPPAKFIAEPVPDVSADTADNPVKLFDLQPHHCRWPFGDPRQPDFHFCGGRKQAGSSYCARHTAANWKR